MLQRLRRVLDSWWFPILLFGGLYLTGWHTPVIGFLQRGMLATGLFQPDTDLPADPADRPPVDPDLLSFRMTDPAGVTVESEALAGKVIFLNLWASWCPPCLAEMPNIDALYRDYAADGRLVFVLLNVEDDFTKGLALVGRRGYAFPVYHLQGSLPAALSSGTLPSTYVIDASGRLVTEHSGMARYDTDGFRSFLDTLIAEVR